MQFVSAPPVDHVRLRFPLQGPRELPLDMHEALYAGLSRICPFIHECPDIRISPVKGFIATGNTIMTANQSYFYIQLPALQIPSVIRLAGRFLRIQQQRCQLGIPEIYPITPSEALVARFVTVRGKLTELEMESYIKSAFLERFEAVEGEDYKLRILRRRVITLHSKKIVAAGGVQRRLLCRLPALFGSFAC